MKILISFPQGSNPIPRILISYGITTYCIMFSKILLVLSGIERRINPHRDTSQFGELEIIKTILSELKPSSDFIIDIGASNGIDASNTYALFKNGAPGLAVEPDGEKFSVLAETYKNFNVNLIRSYATPENITNILRSANTPERPLFMNFDIDSYDYFVLQVLLEEYRPSLMSVEINEKIPIPIKFAVLYNPSHKYTGDHFYGMSISMLGDLCKKYSYDIIGLNYINAFLVPHEKNSFTTYTPEEAYLTGYKEKQDRKEKFPWNANMEELLSMTPEQGIQFIHNLFSKYDGKYILTI